jgi:predicted  nucleic acid-binding Zn-ribbon protein
VTDVLHSHEDLVDLQKVDLEIDRLLNERQSLPELEHYRKAQERLAALQRDHTTATAALRATSLDMDKGSGELDLAEAKLASEQNRLYAGGLSARDATFLRQEVEMLARKKGEMEDEVLELLELREEQEAEVDRLAEIIVDVGVERDRLEALIKESWKGIDARLARKEVRKADIVPLIEPALLELYEELRPIKDGVAVGRLAEDTCGGCHLRLTAAEQLYLKKSDPFRCLHCRRILVI